MLKNYFEAIFAAFADSNININLVINDVINGLR